MRCRGIFFVGALVAGCRTAPLDVPPRSPSTDVDGEDGWRTDGSDARRTSRSPSPGPAGAHERWVFAPAEDVWSAVVDAEGNVYAGGARSVSSLRPDGSTRWTSPVPFGAAPLALAARGTLYSVDARTRNDVAALSDLQLTARDAATGATRWELPYRSSGWAQLAVADDETVYLATGDAVRAVDRDGRQRWIGDGVTSGFALGPDGSIVNDRFTRNASGENATAIVSRDAATGAARWTTLLEVSGYFPPSAPVIGADGTLYVYEARPYEAHAPLGVVALSPLDGRRLWRAELRGEQFSIDDLPAIGPDGTIYVNGYDRIWAIAPDGSLRWIREGVSLTGGIALGSDGTIFAAGFAGSGYLPRSEAAAWAFDETGQTLFTVPGAARGSLYGAGRPVLAHRVLYVVLSDDGATTALHAIGAELR